jgi:hypothetical protein
MNPHIKPDTRLQRVPVYWISDVTQHPIQSVPVVVTLLFCSPQGQLQLTPAVQKSIDAAVQVTGRSGLATALLKDADDLPRTVDAWLARALAMPEVIVLLCCQTADCAERLMMHLQTRYTLSLVRETAP